MIGNTVLFMYKGRRCEGVIAYCGSDSLGLIVHDNDYSPCYNFVMVPRSEITTLSDNTITKFSSTTYDYRKINTVLKYALSEKNSELVSDMLELERTLPTTNNFKCQLEDENGDCRLGTKLCHLCIFGQKCSHCQKHNCEGCRYHNLDERLKRIYQKYEPMKEGV